MKQDIEKVLLSEETIAAKVKELGAQIAKDYADKNPLIVSVLRGSFVFMADLVRAIDVPCTVDFMSVSSYGGGTTSSGEVKITKDFDVSIEGRHLIIVEDILDSGRTLSYLMKTLKARGAASIALCTFLNRNAAWCRLKLPTRASRFRMHLLWVMVWITTRNTATCRMSAFSSRRYMKANNISVLRKGVTYTLG